MAATFFGEITDLESRAVCLSDDEIDDDEELDSIRIEADSTIDLSNCEFIFITRGKRSDDRNNLKASLFVEGRNEEKSIIAQVYEINETTAWILIVDNCKYLKNHFVVESLHLLLSTLIGNMQERSPSLIFLAPYNEEEPVCCLFNDDKIAFPRNILSNVMLPPRMLYNNIESCIFQHCTVKCLKCAVFYFSDKQAVEGVFPERVLRYISERKNYLKAANDVFA